MSHDALTAAHCAALLFTKPKTQPNNQISIMKNTTILSLALNGFVLSCTAVNGGSAISIAGGTAGGAL
jgi:hypothetical protein